jgi:hypothetical protein
LRDHEAKEFDFGNFKLAFLGFDKQLMFSENLEDFPRHLPENFKIGVENEDIINVDQHATSVNAFPKNLIHH